ncbi:MAG: ComF family protein [Desulfomonile tiedjei]|nr:ComF family protein [Desulfomonile tiedjei]
MIRAYIREVRESFSSLLFPPVCSFCDALGTEEPFDLCRSCQCALKWVSPPFCEHCGRPLVGLSSDGINYCGRCLSAPPPYTRARYAVFYEGGLRDGLLRFKYHAALHVGGTLSALLIEAFEKYWRPEDFHLILPVPVHRKRLVQRGFNQALLLARKLSRVSGIPVAPRTLVKIRDTRPQVGLTLKERKINLSKSFGIACAQDVRDRSILLVDDVATTGTTLAEASKTILDAGAQSVQALALALRADGAGSSQPSHVPETSA